jgi:glycosyltransferase involved in cell wall biosynthesis
VEPGTDATAAAHGSGQPELQLLCVGSLTPRKGHAVLFDALAALRDHPWRLICAGSDSLSPETSASLRAQLRRLALTARVSLTGEVSSAVLADLYAGSDVFVLATWFEGYGMALAEALAHGLPVVSTDAGATRATVPKGAGILVPPGDSGALSRALARVIEDPVLRCRLAAGARQAGQGLGSWQDTCAAMAGALRGVGP